MNVKTKSVTAILAIAAAFSAFAFLVPFKRTPAFFIAYGAGILAVILQAFFLRAAFKGDSPESRFLGFPVFRVGYYYLGIQIALSLAIFALGFIGIPAWLSAVLCAVVLCAALACGMAADTARTRIENIGHEEKMSTRFIEELRKRSSELAEGASDPQIKKSLRDVAESIRFSDPVSSPSISAEEQELLSAFDRLSAAVSANNGDIPRLCDDVRTALAARNTACKAAKQ